MLEGNDHAVLRRIEDAATNLAAPMVSHVIFGRWSRDKEVMHRQRRETAVSQLLSRMLAAHSAIELGLKRLINKRALEHKHSHDLSLLLVQLRSCDPDTAESLDAAFAAAIEVYETDTKDPDFHYLSSLPEYLGKSGTEKQFQLMRYLEVESSIDDPALEYLHIEFHYEILRALGEMLLPRYGTIVERVEEAGRDAFLDPGRLESLGAHGEASRETYLAWLQDQGTYTQGLKKLNASENKIGDEHADQAARGVCNELARSEDLGVRTVAYPSVRVEPTQEGEIDTCVWRAKGSVNRVVTTPAGDRLGLIRRLATGAWLATDDPFDTDPAWFRSESDARLYLAKRLLVELRITTERGSSSYQVVADEPYRDSEERRWVVAHRCNWADAAADKISLRLWSADHDLRLGDRIEICTKKDSIKRDSDLDFSWYGRVSLSAEQCLEVSEIGVRRSQAR